MIRSIAVLALLFAALSAGQDTQSQSESSSHTAISTVEQLLGALVDAAQLAGVQERFDALFDVVDETHDLSYIGELTVRRQWREWSSEQRLQFVDAFARLSVMTYASRFANVDNESFRVLGMEAAGGERVQVNVTVARVDGSPVPLDFVLQQSDDREWTIANVVADGVSDLALKRAEYRTVLMEGGFDGLIEELQAQTRTLMTTE